MDEQPLEDVFVLAQVGPSHGAGLVAVGEGAFDYFAAPFAVADAFLAFDALSVFVDGFFLGGFVFPFSPAAFGFADAGGQAVVFVQGAQGIVGMVAFVGDDFAKGLEAVAAARLLGYIAQGVFGVFKGFVNRGRVAEIRALQGHTHNRAALHINGVFAFVREARISLFHLGDAGVGVVG
ncbi:MAG: hypothetical protein QGG73_05185, partial [Candidatus Hydrogenedentes bacterium]|nr:hypothetical protein [Candidatus Hydrogenedentota bacterium]